MDDRPVKVAYERASRQFCLQDARDRVPVGAGIAVTAATAARVPAIAAISHQASGTVTVPVLLTAGGQLTLRYKVKDHPGAA